MTFLVLPQLFFALEFSWAKLANDCLYRKAFVMDVLHMHSQVALTEELFVTDPATDLLAVDFCIVFSQGVLAVKMLVTNDTRSWHKNPVNCQLVPCQLPLGAERPSALGAVVGLPPHVPLHVVVVAF